MAIPSLLGPLGFFIQAPGMLTPPSPVLADNINPSTRDFASLFVGADVIDAQVQLALSTIKGSGISVTEDGISNLPSKMTTSYKRELAASARFALRRLIRAGDIQLRDVLFDIDDESTQTTQMRVVYRNLRSVDAVDTSVSLPVPGRIV